MPHTPPYDPARRDFLRTVVLSAASLVLLPRLAEGDEAQAAFVDLGAASRYSDGAWTRVVLPADYNKEVVYVRKGGSDPTGFQAVSARCTHRGCTVDYRKDDHEFVCPCHGAAYDDNAVNTKRPARSPLNPLAVRIDKDHLFVAAPPKTSSQED